MGGELQVEVGEVRVDAPGCFAQGFGLGPVAGEQVVVEDVDEDAGVAAAGGRDAVAAAAEGGVGFGVAVDGAVQGDAPRQVGRQSGATKGVRLIKFFNLIRPHS